MFVPERKKQQQSVKHGSSPAQAPAVPHQAPVISKSFKTYQEFDFLNFSCSNFKKNY